LADAQANRPLRRDDIFRIASQTKAITATAVMMKQTQGTTSDSTGWKFRLLVGQSVAD